MKDMKKSKFIVLLLLFCLQSGFLAAPTGRSSFAKMY